ncbi:GNAT family N-acetyltransferase [Pseudomonas sp. YuFO20]|uniref:GNAT family N-acetyltransferase n=1 Tax=unclassified Pseudomonas TaxID=196821 RepID=UPI002B255E9F|nr:MULTISPECIES: GNAT family N-acetyltransferase [unclassified Pseudomonas]MEB2519211.1 GNAT family N-acetyltransferase [Pseudomonas sp. YuFO20]MEB2626472.1 GNAT family N-acetyltransferase [Pseudomonas sp. YuFO8]
MPAHIRLAVPADAPLLPRIERSAAQAFRSIDGLGWLADAATLSVERHRQLIALSTCWVAVDAQGQPQGFLSAERHGSDLHIEELSVCQSMQGQGWGRKLVETAMDHARSNHLRCVTLTTFTHVPWNAPFYQRLGFLDNAGATLDERLADILAQEYAHGFEPGMRCAMSWRVAQTR